MVAAPIVDVLKPCYLTVMPGQWHYARLYGKPLQAWLR